MAATALLGGACSASNDDRKRAVKDVVAESVGHQAAMLGILEAHKDDRAQALALLDAYLQANGPSLDRIAHQRALLESDMAAMADAMKTYGAALGQNLERRQRLETDRPELMADPQVRAALARLDAL
ncbi:MAG: hypothetical protein U1F43_10390 [Myxococcota bacterium]